MKKCLVSLFVVLVLVSSVCFASDRYQLTSENRECACYFDKPSARVLMPEGYIDAWIKYEFKNDGSYLLRHEQYNVKRNTVRMTASVLFDKNHNRITGDNEITQWMDVVPASNGEKTWSVIINWLYDESKKKNEPPTT